MTDVSTIVQSIYIPPTNVVRVRRNLYESWQTVTGLHVDALVATSGQAGYGQARLSYRAGFGFQIEGPQHFDVWLPINIDQWQIEITGFDGSDPDQETILYQWYGIVVSDDRELYGTNVGLDEPVENMWQSFQALDMSYLLDKVRVNVSYIEGRGQPIGRAVTFNSGRGSAASPNVTITGNRSVALDGESHAFAASLAGAEKWTNTNIARYLAERFRPVVGGEPVPVRFTDDSIAVTWDTPVIDPQGRTVKSLLDQLFDRRRLVGWTSRWNEDDRAIEIRVFSYNESPVALPSGHVIDANPNQVTFNFDTAFDVVDATLRRMTNLRALQVVMRGARRGAVFTVGKADETLLADWTSGGQTAYNNGASGAGGYGSLAFAERRKRNAIVRAQDDLQRVYRYFKLPDDWDGWAGDGEAGIARSPVFPLLDAGGELTGTGTPIWVPGLEIQNYLPLLTDHDYSALPPVDNTPAGGQAETRPILVAVKTPQTANDATDRWANAEDLVGATIEDTLSGPSWRITPRAQQQRLGLVLDVMGGEQHRIAAAEFTPTGDEDTAAALDWQTDLLATVFVEGDDRVAVHYPAQLADGEATGVTVLELEDEQYRLDYIAPGTVVGTADGQLVRNADGGWFRNDLAQMVDHARAAYEWYSRVRAVLSLTVRQATPLASVGDLITTIGAGPTLQTVNTPITSISVQFGDRDQSHPPVTTFQTDFGEVDFQALFRGPPASQRPPGGRVIPPMFDLEPYTIDPNHQPQLDRRPHRTDQPAGVEYFRGGGG